MTYRINPQAGFSFDGGLVVDNFAGGGGASTGIEAALGRSIDIAVNHDSVAIKVHTANHPHTRHFQESVWEVDPRKVCGGRPVWLAWFSPDCRHFSKAKGSAPVSPRVRGLAWVALRWAATVRPRVIMLENVEEFTTWGPLVADSSGDLRPCPDRKGRTFTSFVNALRSHGYQVEWRELRACDYGAPTIRKRLFLIARCDGLPIVWPEPTHGDPASAAVQSRQLKPWRAASDVIDWSLPCPSIFTRKRPLADATLRRIAVGLRRFVIDADKPFLVPGGAGFLTECANASSQRNFRLDEPMRTQVATTKGGHFALVHAFLAKHYTGVVGHGVEQPLGTITAVDHHSLVTSHMVKLRGSNVGHAVDDPLHTISAGGTHHGEVRAFLVKYYGNEKDGVSLETPLHTIPTRDRFGLVMVRGEPYQIVDIGMRMLAPHELAAAQGFPSNYILDRLPDGTPVTKTDQVRLIGNSVCPPLAEALVRANVSISEMEAVA